MRKAIVSCIQFIESIAGFLETLIIIIVCRIPPRAGMRFYGVPLLRGKRRIRFGRGFVCVSRCGRNVLGVPQRTCITAHHTSAGIVFGEYCGVSGAAIYSRNSIAIGNRVLVGSGAMIIDTDAHGLAHNRREEESAIQSGPIRIEDDVFIGARAIVLKNVTIGRGAVIGAGAVVAKDVPPGSVVVGNPARIVRINPLT